jgi:hypothetical protein
MAKTVEDLFSDVGPFNEEEVVEAIQPFVTIQRSTNRIFLKDAGISADKKILVYGLAKKLLRAKGLVETEMITAQEFHEVSGIKKGTVDPAFKHLKDTGFLVGKKEYEIPVHKINLILKMFPPNI